MQLDVISQQATSDIGGYLLTHYRDANGTLSAANGVSALGALAGIFAQIQARALMRVGEMPQTEGTFLEVSTKAGEIYYFGDAINRCVMEGSREKPSFWNVAAVAANDQQVAEKIDLADIARRAARDVGTANFGRPQIDARYRLSEAPVDAVRTHGPVLLRRFLEIELDPRSLSVVFGSVAQTFAAFAAGEIKDVRADVQMKRLDIVRLYMEAAIPMSKLDLRAINMAIEPKAPLT